MKRLPLVMFTALLALLAAPAPAAQLMAGVANDKTCGAAIDGDAKSRWDTKVFQAPGQWFQIELPEETEIAGLRLDTTKSANDYPRGYKVELSADGQTWD